MGHEDPSGSFPPHPPRALGGKSQKCLEDASPWFDGSLSEEVVATISAKAPPCAAPRGFCFGPAVTRDLGVVCGQQPNLDRSNGLACKVGQPGAVSVTFLVISPDTCLTLQSYHRPFPVPHLCRPHPPRPAPLPHLNSQSCPPNPHSSHLPPSCPRSPPRQNRVIWGPAAHLVRTSDIKPPARPAVPLHPGAHRRRGPGPARLSVPGTGPGTGQCSQQVLEIWGELELKFERPLRPIWMLSPHVPPE